MQNEATSAINGLADIGNVRSQTKISTMLQLRQEGVYYETRPKRRADSFHASTQPCRKLTLVCYRCDVTQREYLAHLRRCSRRPGRRNQEQHRLSQDSCPGRRRLRHPRETQPFRGLLEPLHLRPSDDIFHFPQSPLRQQARFCFNP
jgi:hypothetical protein